MRFLEPQKGAPNAKRCLKFAEHNRAWPILKSVQDGDESLEFDTCLPISLKPLELLTMRSPSSNESSSRGKED